MNDQLNDICRFQGAKGAIRDETLLEMGVPVMFVQVYYE